MVNTICSVTQLYNGYVRASYVPRHTDILLKILDHVSENRILYRLMMR